MKIIGQIRSCPHAIVDILLYQKLIDIISIVIQYPSEEPATSKSPKNQKNPISINFLFLFNPVTISNKILFPEDPSNYPNVLEKPTRGPAILEKPQNKSLVTIHDKTELESNVQKRTKSKDPKNQVQSPTSKEETSPNDPVKPIQVQRPKK